jgi:hypothetical protein
VPFLCSQHIAKDCCGLSSRNGTLVSLGWATTAAQEIDATPSCQDGPARIDAQEDGGAATVEPLNEAATPECPPAAAIGPGIPADELKQLIFAYPANRSDIQSML